MIKLSDEPSSVPRPFPGKYPTRVKITSRDGGFTYEGKPSPELLGYIRRKYLRNGGYYGDLSYKEYDQNGLLFHIPSTRDPILKLASFSKIYFPVFPVYFSYLSRGARWWVFLEKEVTGFGTLGKVYVSPHLLRSPLKDAYLKFVEDTLKGKPMIKGLSSLKAKGIFNFVEGEADKWTRATVVGVPKVPALEPVQIPDAPAPLRADLEGFAVQQVGLPQWIQELAQQEPPRERVIQPPRWGVDVAVMNMAMDTGARVIRMPVANNTLAPIDLNGDQEQEL